MPLTVQPVSVAGCGRNRHPRPGRNRGRHGLPVYSTLYKGSPPASYDVDIGASTADANAAQASLEAQKPPPLPQI